MMGPHQCSTRLTLAGTTQRARAAERPTRLCSERGQVHACACEAAALVGVWTVLCACTVLPVTQPDTATDTHHWLKGLRQNLPAVRRERIAGRLHYGVPDQQGCQ
jgi:hypothetical protein